MTVLQRRRVSPHKHARNRHLRCQPFKACIVAFSLTNPGRRLTSNTLEGCATSLTARRAAERRRRTGSAAAAAIQRFGRWRTAGHRRRPCPGQSSVLLPAFLSETSMSLPSSPHFRQKPDHTVGAGRDTIASARTHTHEQKTDLMRMALRLIFSI